MTGPTSPAVDFGPRFTKAQVVPESTTAAAAHAELTDAKTVLAALRERPDWQVQPGEINAAAQLVDDLTAKHHTAEVAAHEARQNARQAAYEPAIEAANEHTERLAAEAPRLLGRLAEIVAGLAQLIADTDDHREQVRRLTGQHRAVRDTAREHREEEHLPASSTARIPDVPRGDVLASPLLTLRQALKHASPQAS